MLETDLDRFMMAMDYIDGTSDKLVGVSELALIYSILPELMLEMSSPEGLMLTTKKEE